LKPIAGTPKEPMNSLEKAANHLFTTTKEYCHWCKNNPQSNVRTVEEEQADRLP